MHQGQREKGVGSGVDGEVLVGQCRGAGAVRVDDDQACAVAAGGLDEGPQMDVVAVDVGSPGDDEGGVGEVLRGGAKLDAVDGEEGRPAGGGADSAVELGGS